MGPWRASPCLASCLTRRRRHWAQSGQGALRHASRRRGARRSRCRGPRSEQEGAPPSRSWEAHLSGTDLPPVPPLKAEQATWGQGYATEAAAALLHWAQERLPDELVVARIRPTNLASQRVATKIGLRRDPTFDGQGEDGLDWAFTDRS
ncbi:GNAT family N-acetyltransferase [Intrasporangium chromatireducens]|uniref:GNAT family N-acetyltransferase n=1 Tax=Intrasporangium chromatireducens TaxID=1386088 RepID=UPI003B82FBED